MENVNKTMWFYSLGRFLFSPHQDISLAARPTLTPQDHELLIEVRESHEGIRLETFVLRF